MSEPYFAQGSVAMLALEGMVDKVGLRNVLWALAAICDTKAKHILGDRTDSPSARAWTLDAVELNKLAGRAQT